MVEGKQRPRILLVAAGGTISMDKDQQTGKSVPVRTGADLVAQSSVSEIAAVRVVDFPEQSRSMRQSEDLLALAHCLQREAQHEVDGVVVTQGTDTLEEVAYFMDEVVPVRVPFVFTGAMRPAWAVGYDGSKNLQNAVRLATVAAPEYGTLVTMNDEFFEAWSVYKADTGALNAFAARRGTPCGRIFADHVEFTWRPVHRMRFGRIPETLPSSVPIMMM